MVKKNGGDDEGRGTAPLREGVENGDRELELPRVVRLSRQFQRGEGHGFAPLPTRLSAALRRMDPERPVRAMDAVVAALTAADIPLPRSGDGLRRWSAVLNMFAMLSGTEGARVHAGRSENAVGRRLQDARYSENRLARLLTTRGTASRDQVRRVARFLAAKRAQTLPLDTRPLVDLLLYDGRDPIRAEEARLRLARDYYAAAAPRKTHDV